MVTIDFSRDGFVESATIPMSMSLDKGKLTSDGGVVTPNQRLATIDGKNYQSESNTDSSIL